MTYIKSLQNDYKSKMKACLGCFDPEVEKKRLRCRPQRFAETAGYYFREMERCNFVSIAFFCLGGHGAAFSWREAISPDALTATASECRNRFCISHAEAWL